MPARLNEPNRSALQQRRGGCRDRSEFKNRTEPAAAARRSPARIHVTREVAMLWALAENKDLLTTYFFSLQRAALQTTYLLYPDTQCNV